MDSWMPSLFAYLAIGAAGMLAHLRLHRALPARLRPVAGTMTSAMVGMLAGLWVDASRGHLDLLVSLCGRGLPLGQSLRWHFGLLVASNAGLVLAGVLPMLGLARAGASGGPRRASIPTLFCVGSMLAGMNLGMPLLMHGPGLPGGAPGLAWMLAQMQAGMTWGAAAALAVLCAAVRLPDVAMRAADWRRG
jgi:hypothetical protein